MVQQTFCQAIDKLGSYRGEAPLYAWFASICRHVLVDHCRRRSRERAHVLLLEDHADIRAVLDALTAPAGERPETLAAARDLRRLVQAILDRLPPRYADVLEWKYVEGLTVKEIAGRLESGPKAAESMLSRARVAFREALAVVSGAAGGKGVPSP